MTSQTKVDNEQIAGECSEALSSRGDGCSLSSWWRPKAEQKHNKKWIRNTTPGENVSNLMADSESNKAIKIIH